MYYLLCVHGIECSYRSDLLALGAVDAACDVALTTLADDYDEADLKAAPSLTHRCNSTNSSLTRHQLLPAARADCCSHRPDAFTALVEVVVARPQCSASPSQGFRRKQSTAPCPLRHLYA